MKTLKKSISLLSLAAAALVTFSSCNKDETLGQDIIPAKEGFSVLTFSASDDNPDFIGGDTVTCSATFSDEVTAVVTMKGVESGAEKEFVVNGTGIDPEDFTWKGTHDGLYFFRSGEQVAVELSFFGTDLTLADTITLASDAKWPDNVYILPGSEFEVALDWGNGQWWAGVSGNATSGELGLKHDPIENPLSPGTFIERPPQGTGCFVLSGIRGAASTYIGGASQGVRDAAYLPISSNPDSVYINIYCYGFGASAPATQLYVIPFEADGDRARNEAGVDDGVLFTVPVDHEGWELVSMKYSSIPQATYCVPGVEGGGCGNKVHEPGKIDLMAVDFNAEGFELVAGAIDCIIFTYGEPFDPSKY